MGCPCLAAGLSSGVRALQSGHQDVGCPVCKACITRDAGHHRARITRDARSYGVGIMRDARSRAAGIKEGSMKKDMPYLGSLGQALTIKANRTQAQPQQGMWNAALAKETCR